MSISIYTKTGCPNCQAAKEWLKSQGAKYEEINLSAFPDKIDEMLRASGGTRKVPVIIDNGKVTVGFNGGG